jgi:hypothetical protein
MKLSVPVHVEVSAGASAYAESLRMILQHVADFHITVVNIISDKYNIPVDEIMNTVASDSRYTNMVVDPEIHRLTALNEDQVSKTIQPVETKSLETKSLETKSLETKSLETKSLETKKISEKKIKIKPKNSIAFAPASNL